MTAFTECKLWLNGVPVELEDFQFRERLSRRQRRMARLATRRINRGLKRLERCGGSFTFSIEDLQAVAEAQKPPC
jgi:hypothetical protein